jgi:pimeloyl-ACP methyl ester carboxylesterase
MSEQYAITSIGKGAHPRGRPIKAQFMRTTSENHWYEIKRYSTKTLILWSLLIILITILAAFFPSVTNAEEIELKTPTGSLYGTLEIPTSLGSPPLVLIISGSGPTDRDGNSQLLQGKNNSLKYLAEALARKGVASLRFDKRGVGKSASAVVREDDFRFETYIDDVTAWMNYLKKPNKYGTHFILGHSDGSLIGMVASRRGNVDGFISIAGAGRPAPQLIIEQMKSHLSPDLMRETERILGELKAGRTVASPPPALNALFRESVQPYLISWFKYDPAKEIAKLNIPVLIIGGTTDIQVPVNDAKILKNASKKATLFIVEGMNHIFKSVPNDAQKQLTSYSDSSLPVSEKLVNGILEFIHSVVRGKPL